MRVLVIASRYPWPAYSGDRMRTSSWLAALAPHARVALVAPEGAVPTGVAPFDFYPARRSFTRGVRGAFTILSNGLPIQSLLAAPYDWDRAIAAARHDLGDFDTTIVILARTDPWLRGSLEGGVKILDAIDSLRRNAAERGNAASIPMRWFWRQEERRLARAEKDVATFYDHIVVVSEEETSDLGANAVAIGNGVPVATLTIDAPRQFDFGFWGRLAYFANADAAMWLIDEIWPAILDRNPSATCVIAGADAPLAIRRAAERRGITFISPVDNVAAVARSVRVALLPIRYGSGQSNKVVEAGEAGCAIVATRQALRGLGALAPQVRFAHDASSFADAALALLVPHARDAAGSALRRVTSTMYSRSLVLDQLAHIAGVPVAAEAVTA
jgi:glycosyltransferase involved in cell wall biosynthesis